MEKRQFRRIYLEKQKALSKERRDSESRRIANSFFRDFDLSGIRVLHTFIPIAKFNEVDTRLIFERVWTDQPNIQIAVPRVDFETNEITNLWFKADTILAKNTWEIEEPAHDEFVESAMIDLVLVPGLCFDQHGHRVGYGKGFYDRFLKTVRPDCVKIGLTYWEPVEKIDDVHEGDVLMDFVINPDGIRNCRA